MPGLTWEGRPAERSPYDSVRLRALVILGGVGAALLLAIFAAVFALTRSNDPVDIETYDPPVGRGVAAAVMDAWAGGRLSSISAAPFDGSEQMVTQLSEGTLSGARWWEDHVEESAYPVRGGFVPVELHRFVLVVGGNAETAARTYMVTVPVSIQDEANPVPAGPPSVGPYVEYNGRVLASTWESAFDPAPLSQRAQNRVIEWVDAYLADNREALSNIAGNQAGDYRGIRGFALDGDVRFIESVRPTNETDYLARISIPVHSGEFRTVLVMELVVVDDGNNVPQVVAWGGVGEGGELLSRVDEFGQPNPTTTPES